MLNIFRSKEEKRIEAEMKREEALEKFNERIQSMKAKREEYAALAAEAELNGDENSYNIAINNLVSLNEMVSTLQQTKMNFDIINITNAVAIDMNVATGLLADMANSKNEIPDIRKIQKTSAKLSSYMRRVQISQKAVGSMLKTNNPSNKARTQAELQSVRPMIDAAKDKILARGGMPTAASAANTSDIDSLLSQIDSEKNKVI